MTKVKKIISSLSAFRPHAWGLLPPQSLQLCFTHAGMWITMICLCVLSVQANNCIKSHSGMHQVISLVHHLTGNTQNVSSHPTFISVMTPILIIKLFLTDISLTGMEMQSKVSTVAKNWTYVEVMLLCKNKQTYSQGHRFGKGQYRDMSLPLSLYIYI